MVEGRMHQRFGHQDDATHRIVGEMGIGRVPLHAMHCYRARDRATPADLDHVAEPVGIGRFADQAGIPALAPVRRPFQQFDGPVDRRAFLVAGNQQR
ncbi:hypothetical protein D3C87_2005400 [compost metagenome]